LKVPKDGPPKFIGEALGPPLGAVPFAHFGEKTIELQATEMLVFYTDGLVEDRQMSLDVGLDRMREAISVETTNIEELADHVVRACLGDRVVDDDVALLVVRALPLSKRLTMRLSPRPTVLGSFRQTLRRWLHAHEIPEDDAQAVLIACGEACNNAIEHGASRRDGWFEVEVDIDEDLTVVVRNQGGWRAPRSDGGGRGLPVMEGLMDEVRFDRGPEGIEVRMRRKLHRAGIGS
jgi:anti-sigma regulatory factor (Ser/Thr protein kinase)